MEKLIEKRLSYKVFECNSLYEADKILAENNIKYDCMYKNLPIKESIHIYFNNGKTSNVAYYTPIMNTLTIINRPDGIPEDKRKYL